MEPGDRVNRIGINAWWLACSLLLAAPGAVAAGSLEDVAARIAPSIVRVAILSQGEEQGNGTGFVVRDDGVLVTNHHVVSDEESEYVALFADGTKRKVLGTLALDKEHDIALLRLEPGQYKSLELAPSTSLTVGQQVFILGSSYGLDQSLGTGVLSALRDDFPAEWKERKARKGESITRGPLVQHTAVAAPGSSGAPVVDLEGRVIGVHHSGMPGTPINFAAHVDLLRALLATTDLNAPPGRLGPAVGRNLLISLAFFGVLALAFIVPPRVSALLQRRRKARMS